MQQIKIIEASQNDVENVAELVKSLLLELEPSAAEELECAAIYAGGVFGEISELYVRPEYRSSEIGGLLLSSALEKARELKWKRLEVGSPPPNENPRTIKFYEKKGFKCTGSRLRCLLDYEY